jgi:hypothetical protein
MWKLEERGERRSLSESRWQAEPLSLPPAFTLGYCSAYSSTLKMEAICSSEISVVIQRITRRYIPEDDTLHNHRCENLKSYVLICAIHVILYVVDKVNIL